jgi:hypothetical protein
MREYILSFNVFCDKKYHLISNPQIDLGAHSGAEMSYARLVDHCPLKKIATLKEGDTVPLTISLTITQKAPIDEVAVDLSRMGLDAEITVQLKTRHFRSNN